jgi:pilus assembly protein CpaB
MQRPNIKINKTWLMLIIAIVLSLLTTWLTLQYLRFREQHMEAEIKARSEQGMGAAVQVVVPTKSLQPGTVLSEDMVAARDVPADFVYDDTITVAQFDSYKRQVLLRGVERGKPLRRADVREVFADFAGSLKPGKRAMTISVDENNSVSHMIEPGNMVDLFLLMPAGDEGSGGSGGNQTVVPFLDQIRVLATGQKVTHDDPAAQNGGEHRRTYSDLTLEVTPTQAARLALGIEIGKIRAVLRNDKDKQQVDFESVSADNVLDDIRERARRTAEARPPRPAPVLPKMRQPSGSYVEYIIGGKGSSDAVAPTINVPALPGLSMAAPTSAAPSAVQPPMATPQTLTDLMKLSNAQAASNKSSK